MPNWFENRHAGLNRENPSDAALNLDGNGLSNLEEYQSGTDPTKPDTDGDGFSDGDEVTRATPIRPSPGPESRPGGVAQRRRREAVSMVALRWIAASSRRGMPR